MIPPNWRFYTTEGALTYGGPHTWTVIDWDQRRWIAVTGPANVLPDDDSGETMVARYTDQLPPDVLSIKVSAEGELESFSNRPDDDPTWEIRYPEYYNKYKKGEVVRRSELCEVDRLHVCTDVVRYQEGIFAFKYMIFQQRVQNIWDELHILKGLRGHDSFVAFHRTVIDDVSEKVLGFTSQYIAGGTLQSYPDVAPRNILVEPSTETLKIFDFDRAARIGSFGQMVGRNDVDGVIFTVYEALTKDVHYREVPFDEQEVQKVEPLDDWKLDKVPLDDGTGGITAY